MSNRNQKQWSDELNQEVSLIKPDLVRSKEKQIPRFTYSTAEYNSYVKNGFGAPELINRSDKFEVRVLESSRPVEMQE